ncbi:MAG: hypothetical protein ABFE07_29085 [Armatimonadia bacterium]
MNSTISKLADENDLLPHQIQRVCELANHRTYAELFKSAKDKTFKFEMADPEAVMRSLEVGAEKLGAEYMSAPRAASKVDVKRIFGLAEISNAPEVEEKVKQAAAGLETIAAAKAELESRLVDLGEKLAAANEDLYKLAKQMVLEGTELGTVWEAARRLDGGEAFAADFGKIAVRLCREGVYGAKLQHLLKQAEAVDEALISKGLAALAKPTGIEIVNGRHPIMVSLNTLADYRAQRDRTVKAVQNLAGSMVAVRSRMDELGSSKKLDQFVLTEQQKA